MSGEEFMSLVMMTRDFPHFIISRFLQARKLRYDSLLNGTGQPIKTFYSLLDEFEDVVDDEDYETSKTNQVSDELTIHLPSLSALETALESQIEILNSIYYPEAEPYKPFLNKTEFQKFKDVLISDDKVILKRFSFKLDKYEIAQDYSLETALKACYGVLSLSHIYGPVDL